ncbi:MAG: hypothetical protein ACOCP4_05490 [Candidatus Woesearchaeota archaeon]
MDKEYFQHEGILKKIEKNESNNERAPVGFVYFEEIDIKFTVWKKNLLDCFIEKGRYKILYTIKNNVFKGMEYTSYNVEDVIDKNIEYDRDRLTFSKNQLDILKDNEIDTKNLNEGSGENHWKIMDYPLIFDESVEEIRVPRKVFDFMLKISSLGGENE